MILKIIISVFLGFLIGLEREWHGKSVGIKTISLVTLGSTLFVLMSPTFGDNSRIVAQVVSGLAFLCTGVIIKDGDSVSGFTTAATIWPSAALGCLVGMDYIVEAIFGTCTIIFINIIFKYFKHEH